MTIQEILEVYRKESFSEHDKGKRFERLMQAFLRTSPIYRNLFKQIWMWEDFPARQDFGGKDIGIDLVAETVDGKFWAVQCKCYKADAQVTKPAVDSFLATSCKMFTMPGETEKTGFAHRLWIATTNLWNKEAETIINDTQPPVTRILLKDLENSGVDWGKIYEGLSGNKALKQPKTVREHQHAAIKSFHEHFQNQDRGRLIMACGTGKTFTALKIMEQQTNGKGLVLFLVPSIALLNQALIAWMTDTTMTIQPICVCSDAKASRKREQKEDSDEMAVVDLARPATTDVNSVVQQLHQASAHGELTVVFATYQSIDVVSKAQAILNKSNPGSCIFDLIVCDEAHRTTGVTLKDSDESAFVKVHDNNFLPAKKRLYMTATPRLYTEESKSKAKETEAILCSMDDPAIYGEEVYRMGFGEAVSKQLLSDYKVLVLTVSDRDIPISLQKSIANGEMEINTDDAAKLVGCINALSKRMLVDEELLKGPDPDPMRSAVAFCSNIKDSKKITNLFKEFDQRYYDALDEETRTEVVRVGTDHVDGTMAATERSAKLEWLASADPDHSHCHILHNVRCLSEGVDVPSLDAVLFLSPRNSQVDVVQSVGRVMRRAPGKKYGYIIIPVVIPSDVSPDEALDDNERFKVVWSVLNALRAHDDRFNAMINKIELNKKTSPEKVLVAPPGTPGEGEDGDTPPGSGQQLEFQFVQGLQNAIYARMVEKVGSRRYWEQWASDVADIAKRHIERITKLVAQSDEHRKAFADFLAGLRKNINPSVTKEEAIEMLSQHIITKPVFEALFENYSFVKNNPVSIAMQNMLDLLEDTNMEKDQEVLEKFYVSVKERASGIDNAEGRQRVIVELYDKFFRTAFPMTVEKLGIVYTPVEVVDFIVRSVADVLKQEFGRKLSDENIHILDPFTGTGTFITRLLQCGLITPEALERKYSREIHANEIVLLAYYIASINIENTFHDLRNDGQGEYVPFNGICLTDTFQLGENDDSNALFSEMFPQNSERVMVQKQAPLRVIIGNPPYSVGQRSANDNAQNMSYPKLEQRIADTYAKWSKASSVKALYDSYIKAFRWASDRLDPENGGIIAFVSNSGWLDGNGMDGFRKKLEEEFSAVYVFDLRGNQRTSGELSRREGGKIFGSGSRTPIAITILVKKPKHADKAIIRYCDIGDYLTREEKLAKISQLGSVGAAEMEWQEITPNNRYDWLNQRDDLFETMIPIEASKKFDNNSKSFFITHSLGVATAADSWLYNFCKESLRENMQTMILFFNTQVKNKEQSKGEGTNADLNYDRTKISWNDALKGLYSRGTQLTFDSQFIVPSMYRPFTRHVLYFDKDIVQRPYQIPKLFPTPETQNLVICVTRVESNSGMPALIADSIPDLHFNGDSQCFPLYYYEKNTAQVQLELFETQATGEYTRHDAITDFIFDRCRKKYGHKTTREDIFYYVYGLLHSPRYKERFEADLKKALPRIPLVESVADFQGFSQAGRQLAELHLHYESVEPYDKLNITGLEHNNFKVEKMRFADKDAKDVIIFNNHIKIAGIPSEAYDYVVNGKSAIEWIMERYQVTQHKDSGIVNDPNQWLGGAEPRYIFDLLLKIIRVSLDTMAIVKQLPSLKL